MFWQITVIRTGNKLASAKLIILRYLMGNYCNQIFEKPNSQLDVVLHTQEHQYETASADKLDPQTKHLLDQLEHSHSESQFFKDKQLKKRIGKDQYYKGDWKDTVRKGKGAYIVPGKFIYFGEFDVNPNGRGKFTSFQHKVVYEGNVKDGRINGKGELKHMDGHFVFDGNIQDGAPTHGTLMVYNQETKEREFTVQLQNYPINKAVINYGDYKRYEGEVSLKTFLPEGHGSMKYPNNTVYDGEWAEGEYNGKGTFSWSDGSSYSGHYLKGKKHGQGRFTYSSKKYYEGGWVDGKQEGEGALYSADGAVIQKGRWREGVYEPQKPADKSTDRVVEHHI